MNPIPFDAMPVVEILRRDVPRPKELPQMYGGVVRWRNGSAYDAEDYCPMGLHEHSDSPDPENGPGFANGALTTRHVKAFYKWWDEITEPDIPEAMDAVWPPNGGE